MSAWTDFRNAIEAELEPEIATGITFLQAVEKLAVSGGLGDLETAAGAALSAFEETAGTESARLMAGLEAFATELLAEAVSLVKTAAFAPGEAVSPASS